jgi:hypothetical protein
MAVGEQDIGVNKGKFFFKLNGPEVRQTYQNTPAEDHNSKAALFKNKF